MRKVHLLKGHVAYVYKIDTVYGHNLNKLGRGLLGHTTYQIQRL